MGNLFIAFLLVVLVLPTTAKSQYRSRLNNRTIASSSTSTIATRDAFTLIKATSYNSQSGSQTSNDAVTHLDNDDFLVYKGLNFGTGAKSVTVSIAAFEPKVDYRIVIYQDSFNGPVLANISSVNTGSWFTYVNRSVNLSQTVSGIHDIYIRFVGGTGVANFKSFQFSKEAASNTTTQTPITTKDPYSVNKAVDFTHQSGTVVENGAMAYLDNNDYLVYSGLDFGAGASAVKVSIAALNPKSEYRMVFLKGSLNGQVLATINSVNTGSWTTYTDKTVNLSQSISGVNDIYVLFLGGVGVLNFKTFQFIKSPTVTTKDALATIRAIDYDAESGTVIEDGHMAYLDNNDYLVYKNLNFGSGAKSLTVNIAGQDIKSGYKTEFRQGSLTGPIIATIDSFNTGSWSTFVDKSVNLQQTISGVNDLYVRFVGGIGVINLKSFKFSTSPISVSPPASENPAPIPPVTTKNAFNKIMARNFDAESGTVLEEEGNMGYLDNNDYLVYKNIDFGAGAKSLTVNIAARDILPGFKTEFRLGSLNGTLIATVNSINTGDWFKFVDSSVNLTQTVSGVRDVYVKFIGGTGVTNLMYFQFSTNSVVVSPPVTSNPPPPTSQPPATQNPAPGNYGTRERPFSADSPFNTAIPSKAVYTSSSDPRTRDWQTTVKNNGAYTTGNEWTMWVWETNRDRSNSRLITVKVFDMLCYSSSPKPAYKVSFWAPMNAAPPTGTDAHFLVVDDKDVLHEMYFAKKTPTCYCSNRCNGLAESGVDYYVNSLHQIPLTSTGVGNVGGRMTGFSGLGGLIRAGEITNVNGPQIQHAIALTIKGAGGDSSTPLSSGFVYPASRTGSRGEWKASLRSGERLAIPPHINVEALPIPETHKRLARALQKYGGYISDVGGNNAVWTDGVSASADKKALDSNTAAIKTIMELLVVVDNSF